MNLFPLRTLDENGLHVFFGLFVFPLLDEDPAVIAVDTEVTDIDSHGENVLIAFGRDDDLGLVLLCELDEDLFLAEVVCGNVDVAGLVLFDDELDVLDALVLR